MGSPTLTITEVKYKKYSKQYRIHVESKHVAPLSHYMFNFTTVVFDGPSPAFYFTNTLGWNTSSLLLAVWCWWFGPPPTLSENHPLSAVCYGLIIITLAASIHQRGPTDNWPIHFPFYIQLVTVKFLPNVFGCQWNGSGWITGLCIEMTDKQECCKNFCRNVELYNVIWCFFDRAS